MLGSRGARRVGWTSIAVVSAAVLALGAPALGQGRPGGGGGGGQGQRGFGGGGMGQDMFTPAVDSRELDRYKSILTLDKDQNDIVRSLFEGYNEEFRAAAAEVRSKMEAAREEARASGDRGGFANMRTMTQEFRTKRDAMEKSFFTDVQAILTPEQQAGWPRVERVRRRERTVPRGLMSGERVDVIALVEKQKFAPDVTAAIAPTLEQYELDLDKALIERNKAYEDGFSRIGELFQNGDQDAARAAMQKIMETARTASTRVRDLNRRSARQVQAALPESAQWGFEKAVREASFPQVYRETRAARSLTAAKGFADLDDTQRQGIAALTESFTRDIGGLNEQLAQATEQTEETITADRIFRGRRDEADDGPAGELWRKRRDLDHTTIENLRKLLTPEQVERLPRPEENENQGPGRRGRDGGEGGGDRPQQDRPRRPDGIG